MYVVTGIEIWYSKIKMYFRDKMIWISVLPIIPNTIKDLDESTQSV